jgi:uncharacterized protein YaeQ
MSTSLYRFKIDLADVTRSVYESLDFRVAQHPSETLDYLVTRVLALALNHQDGLKFSAEGLGNPDEPCLRLPNSYGGDLLWIEIGNPSPRKLHKASKASKTVKVYTYKNPELLLQDLRREPVHRAQEIEIYSLAPSFLEGLCGNLSREVHWNLSFNDGSIIINSGEATFEGELTRHRIN